MNTYMEALRKFVSEIPKDVSGYFGIVSGTNFTIEHDCRNKIDGGDSIFSPVEYCEKYKYKIPEILYGDLDLYSEAMANAYLFLHPYIDRSELTYLVCGIVNPRRIHEYLDIMPTFRELYKRDNLKLLTLGSDFISAFTSSRLFIESLKSDINRHRFLDCTKEQNKTYSHSLVIDGYLFQLDLNARTPEVTDKGKTKIFIDMKAVCTGKNNSQDILRSGMVGYYTCYMLFSILGKLFGFTPRLLTMEYPRFHIKKGDIKRVTDFLACEDPFSGKMLHDPDTIVETVKAATSFCEETGPHTLMADDQYEWTRSCCFHNEEKGVVIFSQTERSKLLFDNNPTIINTEAIYLTPKQYSILLMSDKLSEASLVGPLQNCHNSDNYEKRLKSMRDILLTNID